jgi:hypothetical protein
MNEARNPDARAPVGRSILSLLFASSVAAGVAIHFSDGGLFCSLELAQGANIRHAFAVAFLGGLAGSVLVPCVRGRPHLLAAALLFGAAVLGVAIALVALDSALYVGRRSCGFLDAQTTTYNDRLYYLYALWGIPAGFLVWAAWRVLARAPRLAPLSRWRRWRDGRRAWREFKRGLRAETEDTYRAPGS